MADGTGIAVVVEAEGPTPAPLANEFLGLARRLADGAGGAVSAILLGRDIEGAGDELVARGADRVYLADDSAFADYQADVWMKVLVGMIRDLSPTAVLLGHTAMGADLAPRLAFRLETAVAMDCVEAAAEGGRLVVVRPCYGGNAREVITFRTSPAVITVRRKSFAPAAREEGRAGEVVRLRPEIDPAAVRTRIRERRPDARDGRRLENARVVVAGGRGLDGPAGFRAAEALAEVLGGAVGASRVACDLGWCPASYQIGLSGRTVAPDLYVAVGISGAGQHMSGCAGAETIVAINTDPDAPIFKFARFGVVGDGRTVLPALVHAVEVLEG